MTETKTLHKLFWEWDFEKEERWLNTMAQEGWALKSVGLCTYTFERCEPGAYILRLAMLDDSGDCKSFMEELGAECVGSIFQWSYFRRKAELGSFEMFSDIDSRISHLDRIGKTIGLLCIANLGIGVANILNGISISCLNLLCAALLAYGLGRIHGKRESLKEERDLHE